MKYVSLFLFLFATAGGYAQSLPIDFETDISTSDFVDFDGGTATVIDNPQSNGINTSGKVAQLIRNGGATWSGSKIILADNLDFTTLNTISMKVYTSAPVGTTVKFKLEGAGETERDALTTVSDEWEVLTWDFTAEPTNFNTLVFMFDFGNVGDGSATSTFLFDEIEQYSAGTHLDLPVTFQDSTVNYRMTDFGGNVSALVADPEDASNMVMQAIKTAQAATWAGTTIGTPAGFATDIPLTLTDSKMSVKVWSPEAGILVRLKVEDSDDPTHTCETQVTTSVAGGWEALTFDFANEAPGTAALSFGLSNGWTYNMASIFFNFDVDGATAGEKTYYFDDVTFGATALSVSSPEALGVRVFPNPAQGQWTISATQENLTAIQLFDLQGKLLRELSPQAFTARLESASLPAGTYVARISTRSGTAVVRLVKQ
jgi:hypothetical protein